MRDVRTSQGRTSEAVHLGKEDHPKVTQVELPGEINLVTALSRSVR